MTWWDRDSEEYLSKKPRCKVCVNRSILVQSGDGTDLKCPSCKTPYDRTGKKLTFETQAERQNRLADEKRRQLILDAENEEEHWNLIWGGNSP